MLGSDQAHLASNSDMARSKSASKLIQRKTQALKKQLYGKEEVLQKVESNQEQRTHSGGYNSINLGTSKSEISYQKLPTNSSDNYLRHDLLKVLYLSTLAIGFQVALFWALNNGLVSF